MEPRKIQELSKVEEGFIIIKEKTYRDQIYRIVPVDACRYDFLAQVVFGCSRQGDWYCVKKKDFYTNFQSAIDATRDFLKEE